MARRVNTKFVMILSAALVGTVGIFGGVKYYNWSQAHNPDVVMARAKANEKDAEKAAIEADAIKAAIEANAKETPSDSQRKRQGELQHDLSVKLQDRLDFYKKAAVNYASAGQLMSVKHIPGADSLFAQSAELNMKISHEAQTQEDAVWCYQQALENYKKALAENPQNKAVNAKLMEEDYQNAQYFPHINSWKTLEDVTGKLIKNQDGLKPRLYRAEARMRILLGTPQTPTSADIGNIVADLDSAQKFDPHSEEAVALRAEVMWLQARLSAGRRGLTKPEEFNVDQQYMKEVAGIRRMLVRCFQGKWGREQAAPGWAWVARIPLNDVNAEVASTLVTLTLAQFELSGRTDISRLEAAIILLEAAVAAAPSQTGLVDTLGALYKETGHSDKAEALFVQVKNRTPDSPEAYFRLANYYRNRGDYRDYPTAIDWYGEVTKHTAVGSGRDAIRNAEYQLLAVEGIAWLSMDLSEHPLEPPVKDSNGNMKDAVAYMKDAADMTDKLRATHAPKGMIELLDGRAQLISKDIPRAVVTLRAAEVDLKTVPGLVERYRQTELLLARANEMQNQPGAALEYLNKALELKPNDLMVMLRKGQILVTIGRFEEARYLMGKILGETADHKFINENYLNKDFATAAKSVWKAADDRLNPTIDAMSQVELPSGTLQTAQAEMDNNDYRGALIDAMLVLQKPERNKISETATAYRMAIECHLELNQKDEARQKAIEAMAKFPEDQYAPDKFPSIAWFKIAKSKLDQPAMPDPFETLKAITDEAFPEPYLHSVNLAALYHRKALEDHHKALGDIKPNESLSKESLAKIQATLEKENSTLQVARDSLKNASSFEDRAKQGNLLDQQFNVRMTQARLETTDSTRESYYLKAQNVVTELEKLNLDGTDGKIYRGRLELARSEGKTGLQYLQQAVAQRPDLAEAHLVLGEAYLKLASLNKEDSTSKMNAALDEFRQVLRWAPNNIEALQMAIRLLLQKVDPSSQKEAQTLLETGLALAPNNAVLIGFSEIFPEKLDKSIEIRENLHASHPEDRYNIRRLATLYVGLKNKEADPEKKQKAMDLAIHLMRDDYQSHQSDGETADFFARLLVEYDKSDKGAREAIGIYGKFINNSDPAIKLNGLIAKAEFFRTLQLQREAIDSLWGSKDISHNNLRLEAADLLEQAIKLEPATQDEAERHLADMHFDLGNMEMAEQAYQQVLKKNATANDMDRVLRRLIEVDLRLAEFAKTAAIRQAKCDEANKQLEALLKQHPQDIQGLLLRAYSSILLGAAQAERTEQQKYLKSALEDVNGILARDPGNAKALFYRATAQISLGDRLKDAENDLKLAAKLDPASINSQLALAQLHVRMQHYDEASTVYEDILSPKQHPDSFEIRLEYAELLRSLAELQATLPTKSDGELAKSLRKLGPVDKLMEEVQTGIKLYPNDLRWRMMYAQTLALQGKIELAHRQYEWLFQITLSDHAIDPAVCDAYLGSLLRTKDYAKLVQVSDGIIEAAVNVDPETKTSFISKNPEYVSFFLKRAAAYRALAKQQWVWCANRASSDIDRGLEIGIAAATESGKYGPFTSVLSQAAAKQGQAESMLTPELLAERLQVRIATHPSETLSKIGLIQNLLLTNDAKKAIPVVESMIVPTEDENKTLRFLVLNESALVWLQTKRYAAAEKAYQELLKISPNNVDLLNNYAFMLAEVQDSEGRHSRAREAIDYAKRALNLLTTRSDPSQLSASSANVYDTLGWAYYLNGDLTNAEENLRQSVKIQPQAAAFLHLALTLQKGGSKNSVEAQQNCAAGIELAITRHEDETLAALRELQAKLPGSTTARP